MFCARCGEQIADGSETCPLCGREATIKLEGHPSRNDSSATAALAPISEPAQDRPINSKLKGIGGWLLFFCISATILSPLAVIGAVLRSVASESTFNLDTAVVVLISLLGLGAGLSAWTMSQHAIAIVRAYFLALGGFALFTASFLVARGIEDGDITILVANVRSLIFVGLWAAYFHKSERVRATFGRNL